MGPNLIFLVFICNFLIFLFYRVRKYFAVVAILFKSSLVFYFSNGFWPTEYQLKTLIYLGFFSTYFYLLVEEIQEAYFNPNYSKNDLSLKNNLIKGFINFEKSQLKMIVTNISARGIFIYLENPTYIKGKVDGIVSFKTAKIAFSGNVVFSDGCGVGVKVDKNLNWDNLYKSLVKLKYFGW